MINQLFITKPPLDLIKSILVCFGRYNMMDKTPFRILDMERLNTCVTLQNMQDELSEYYLPCKQKKYLNDWSPKNCITIARQFLRVYNFDIISKEKVYQGVKYISYHVGTKLEKQFLKNKLNRPPRKKSKNTKKNGGNKTKDVIISFD